MKRTGLSLKIKNSLLLIAVMVPLFVGFITYEVHQQSTAIRKTLTERGVILAKTGATTMGKILEDGIKSGKLTEQQVFDIDYKLIPNTNPPKYHTAYDAYADANIRNLEDSFLKDKVVTFAVLVDVNGYLPTHNSKYSVTGSGLNTDRSKRKFNDTVGYAAAQNEKEYLFQEYKRDTGEVLWDISAPVYVNGRHWGAFRIGFSIDETNKQIASIVNVEILAGAILTLVLVLLSIYISNRISSRVNLLAEEANRVARGDLSLSQLEIDTRDEVGKLGKSFTNMIIKLRDLSEKTRYSARLIQNYTHDLLENTVNASDISYNITDKMSMVEEAMSKMEGGTVRIAETSNKVAENLTHAEASSQKFLDNMEESKEAMSVTHNVVKELEYQVEKLGQFIQVVSILAEQSDLLAQKVVREADQFCSKDNEMAALAIEVKSKASDAANTTKDVSELFRTVQRQARKASDTLESHRQVIVEGINVARLSTKSLSTVVEDMQNLAAMGKDVLDTSKEFLGVASSAKSEVETQTALVKRFVDATTTLEQVVAELQQTINSIKV